MAKRKTPKVKNLVEIPTSITEEELTSLQSLITSMNNLKGEIGNIEMQKHFALHELQEMSAKMKMIQKDLEKTYGLVNINIKDGTITPIQDEQANKKN